MTASRIRTTCFATSGGAIHTRIQDSRGDAQHPALVCLHPAPFSGLYFTSAMPLLCDNRQVIAPDYPGYGSSYSCDETLPTIGDYAAAMIESIAAISPQEPVDLLGFHTGCLVAVEMALLAPERVGKLVLVDVPYFVGETQKKLRAQMSSPLPLGPELSCLQKSWDFNVSKRLDDMPLARAFALFVEGLRAGTQDYYGFDAAFSYACSERFSQLQQPAVVLATRSGLLEASHAAAEALEDATLVDVMDVTSAVFEKGAPNISAHILSALRDN